MRVIEYTIALTVVSLVFASVSLAMWGRKPSTKAPKRKATKGTR